MLNPDLTAVLDDPDLGGGESFMVIRKTFRHFGRAMLDKEETFRATGNIQPAQPDDLRQLPEEDRKNAVIVIRSTFCFQLGKDGQRFVAPDEVVYLNRRYRVTRVDTWTQWGFHTAYATQTDDLQEAGEAP